MEQFRYCGPTYSLKSLRDMIDSLILQHGENAPTDVELTSIWSSGKIYQELNLRIMVQIGENNIHGHSFGSIDSLYRSSMVDTQPEECETEWPYR